MHVTDLYKGKFTANETYSVKLLVLRIYDIILRNLLPHVVWHRHQYRSD